MEGTLIISALTLGLVSSIHCVGMCGPIAFSLGISQKSSGNKSIFHLKNLTYQLGRIFTYTLLGILAGIIGAGFSVVGVQKYVSIVVGILMILYAIIPQKTMLKVERFASATSALAKLKSALATFIKKRNYLSLFVTGLLNGLLPCGAVYIALIAAIASGGIFHSMVFMFLYGLGTLPLMFFSVYLGAIINARLRNKIVKTLPYVIAFVGVLFILRGLELGIPFLSPPPEALNLYPETTPPHHCH